jgi:hypothetical protein
MVVPGGIVVGVAVVGVAVVEVEVVGAAVVGVAVVGVTVVGVAVLEVEVDEVLVVLGAVDEVDAVVVVTQPLALQAFPSTTTISRCPLPVAAFPAATTSSIEWNGQHRSIRMPTLGFPLARFPEKIRFGERAIRKPSW